MMRAFIWLSIVLIIEGYPSGFRKYRAKPGVDKEGEWLVYFTKNEYTAEAANV